MAFFNKFGRLLRGKKPVAAPLGKVAASRNAMPARAAGTEKKKTDLPTVPQARQAGDKKPTASKLKVDSAEIKIGVPGLGVKFKLRPRVTEKATYLAEKGVYVFDVPHDATKGAIRSAIKTLFKVNPVKIAIVRLPAKKVFARGKKGRTARIKKAYVYLKAGEKIDIV